MSNKEDQSTEEVIIRLMTSLVRRPEMRLETRCRTMPN